MRGEGGEKVTSRSLPVAFYFIAATVLVVDQLTKAVVVRSLALGERIPAIPGLLDLTHNQNPGAAFGILPSATGSLIVVGVFVVVILLLYGRRMASCRPLWVGLALQVGGALGNLADRIFRGEALFSGRVIDFIDVQITRTFTWPTFNVADIAITVGAGLIAYCILTGKDTVGEGDEGGGGKPGRQEGVEGGASR